MRSWLSVSRSRRLRTTAKIYEAIGRKKERYPRVARYYQLAYDEQQGQLSCLEDLQRKQKAESLDGSYLLKSSRKNLDAEDIWRTYILLSRVEAAFRAMKSPLCERPTCWFASNAPSWNKASTLHGKPCAVSFPLTRW